MYRDKFKFNVPNTILKLKVETGTENSKSTPPYNPEESLTVGQVWLASIQPTALVMISRRNGGNSTEIP